MGCLGSRYGDTQVPGFQNYYRPPEVWAPLYCFRIEVSGAKEPVRFKGLEVPQTLFPLLKGEVALDCPKSESPAGRMSGV